MWIVASNRSYYNWVNEYKTYEEAKTAFDELEAHCEDIYLAEVKETKTHDD